MRVKVAIKYVQIITTTVDLPDDVATDDAIRDWMEENQQAMLDDFGETGDTWKVEETYTDNMVMTCEVERVSMIDPPVIYTIEEIFEYD